VASKHWCPFPSYSSSSSLLHHYYYYYYYYYSCLQVAIVYIGCHRSLMLRDRGLVPPEEQEAISKEDAYKFPLIGSCVLFGLYLLFKVNNQL